MKTAGWWTVLRAGSEYEGTGDMLSRFFQCFLCLQGEPGPPGQTGPEGPGGQQGSPGTQGRTVQGPMVGTTLRLSSSVLSLFPVSQFIFSSRVPQESKERKEIMDSQACR